MKPFSIYIFLFLVGFLTTSFKVQHETLHLMGWVIKDENPVRRAQVRVWQNDSLIYETRANRWGHFSMDIPYQHNYILSFTAPGLIHKKVAVDTQIPENFDPTKYYSFEFEVELFEKAPWIIEGFFDDPVAIVYYDDFEKFFDFDHEHYDYYLANLERMKSGFYDIREMDLLANVSQELVINPADHLVSSGSISLGAGLLSGSFALETHIPGQAFSDEVTLTLSAEEIPVKKSQEPHKEQIKTQTEYNSGSTTYAEFSYHKNEVSAQPTVFFSVQVLATVRNIPNEFFNRIEKHLPDAEIIYFKDNDDLEKYAVGTFEDLNGAMNQLRQLRQLNYETYIVAFKDGKKVRVNEALAALDHTSPNRMMVAK